MTDLLAGLDDDQARVAAAPPGPVCVLAGAGTGKTRTITHRIAALVESGHHPVDHILAVTFTSRAAAEMRSRLRALGVPGVQARTFHSAALKQLRYFWPLTIGGDLWPLVERKMRFVAAAAREVGVATQTPLLRDVASEVEWAKARLIGPDDYVSAVTTARRDTPLDAKTVGQIYQAYEAGKTESRQLDFDDLLLHMCGILEGDEDAARTFRSQYRSFVVDEYQDVTPLQQRMLDAWLGGRDDITVVGDANQTIYSFTGASPRYLLGFTRRFPGAKLHRLQRDYRSTPQVVDLANRVISAASGANAKMRLTLKAVLPDGPAVGFDEYPDEPAEARAIAAVAKTMIAGGTPPSSIAVLYRINAQSEGYEQALAKADVPYVVRGGERFFTRQEVRAAMKALQSVADSDHGAGDLVPTVKRILEPLGLTASPPAAGAMRERFDGLAALVSVAEELVGVVPQADVAALVTELRGRAQAQFAPTVEGVSLASLHAAKGLEWDTVFLAGLSDGTVPITHADTPDAVEEERRLLYVGVTRARSRLHLSWALARHEGGRATRRRSRFLTGIVPDSPPRSRGKKSKRQCQACGGPLSTPAEVKAGRCASCPLNADPVLVEKLKAWRKDCAAKASVPAFVVFSDATLLAIAERRPTSDAALLAIPGIGRTKLERFGRDVIDIVTSTR